jgi:hypothetical protein
MYEVEMRSFILFISTFLIFASCQEKRLNLKDELAFVSSIKFNDSYLNKGVVNRPPRVWVELLRYDNGQNIRKCLIFKTPYKDEKGVLKLVDLKQKKCSTFEKGEVIFDGLEELKVQLSSKGQNGRKSYLVLRYGVGEQQQSYEIPLLNYVKRKSFQKYDNQLDIGFIDELSFGKVLAIKTIADGNVCYGVNSECKVVIDNECDKCQSGFYEVVDFNCPGGGSKFCGAIECGKRNQPACPRGYQILDSKLPSLCFDGSPAGLCEAGLRTFCNEDKILICI